MRERLLKLPFISEYEAVSYPQLPRVQRSGRGGSASQQSALSFWLMSVTLPRVSALC